MDHQRDTSTSFGKRVPLCVCGATGVRDEKHDAYYCPTSHVWLELPCGDPDCEFCPDRPEKYEAPPCA